MATASQRVAIRAVLVGFGSTNQAVLELALTRPWLSVVGIVVRSRERDGQAAASRVPGAPVDLSCSTDLLSTAAMIVNGLPRAIVAAPGVYRPGDLPPSAPWLADQPPSWVPLRDRTG